MDSEKSGSNWNGTHTQGKKQRYKTYEYMTNTVIHPNIMIHNVATSDNSKINGKRKKVEKNCNIVLTYGYICVIIKKTIVKHIMEVNTMRIKDIRNEYPNYDIIYRVETSNISIAFESTTEPNDNSYVCDYCVEDEFKTVVAYG